MAAGRNNDGVLDSERDFRASERRLVDGDIPQNVQARALAYFLAHSFEIPVLELMRDQGFDAFTAKVKAGQFDLPHGVQATPLSDDDIRRIYGYILKTLEHRLARSRVVGATH